MFSFNVSQRKPRRDKIYTERERGSNVCRALLMVQFSLVTATWSLYWCTYYYSARELSGTYTNGRMSTVARRERGRPVE